MKEISKECYWCGNSATSEDHCPPKNLFTNAGNYNPIKNPSCKIHNEDLKKIDELFRIYIVGFSKHEVAEDLFINKIERGLEHHKAVGLKKRLTNETVYNENERATHIDINKSDLTLYFEKISRGLFYYHYDKPFIGEFRFLNNKNENIEQETKFNHIWCRHINKGYLTKGKDINDLVFNYSYGVGDNGIIFILMTFYRDVRIIGMLKPS